MKKETKWEWENWWKRVLLHTQNPYHADKNIKLVEWEFIRKLQRRHIHLNILYVYIMTIYVEFLCCKRLLRRWLGELSIRIHTCKTFGLNGAFFTYNTKLTCDFPATAIFYVLKPRFTCTHTYTGVIPTNDMLRPMSDEANSTKRTSHRTKLKEEKKLHTFIPIRRREFHKVRNRSGKQVIWS